MDPSSPSSIASQLRHLLSLLRKYSPQTLSYRGSVHPGAAASLRHLIPSVFNKVGVVQDVEYSVQLLRRLILARFELLCVSTELIYDVRYSYTEIRDILLVLEAFNHHCLGTTVTLSSQGSEDTSRPTFRYLSKERQHGHVLELSNLIDAYINTHTKWLYSNLSGTPSSKNILHLAQFESSFTRALLGLLATYTSLLTRKRKEYVSEEMFSMCLSQESISWSDCLIPGAQSEIVWRTYHNVSRRLWSKVAEGLLARAQPVFVASSGHWQWEFITELLKTSGW